MNMEVSSLTEAIEYLATLNGEMRSKGGPRLRRHSRTIREAKAHLDAAQRLLGYVPEPVPQPPKEGVIASALDTDIDLPVRPAYEDPQDSPQDPD